MAGAASPGTGAIDEAPFGGRRAIPIGRAAGADHDQAEVPPDLGDRRPDATADSVHQQ
jgi:hypothetical protein